MLPFCPRQLLVPAGNDARAVRISLPLPVDLWRRRTVVCCTLPMPSADANKCAALCRCSAGLRRLA